MAAGSPLSRLAGTSARQATWPVKRGGGAGEMRGAQPRADAVGPDGDLGLAVARVGEAEAQPGAGRHHRLDAGAELDPRAGLGRGAEEDVEKVGAVDLPVGAAVAGDARAADRQARDEAAAAELAQLDPVGEVRERRDLVGEPERLEHGDAVRGDLQAGADLGERLGALVDGDPRAALAEGGGGGEPADAAADHRDFAPGEAHAAGASPAQARASSARSAAGSTGRGFR